MTGIISNNPIPVPHFDFQIANLINVVLLLLGIKHVVFLVKVLF